MTNFEKYKQEILEITEDSNFYASLYDLKCLMDNKGVKDDNFLHTFFKWLGENAE